MATTKLQHKLQHTWQARQANLSAGTIRKFTIEENTS